MKQNLKAFCINLMMLLALLLSATACSSESKLKTAVEVANRDCPQVIEGVGMLTSFSYENDNVYCNCTVNSYGYIDIDLIRSMKDELKPGMIEGLVSEARHDDDVMEVLNLVIDANANIIYRFSDSSGDSEDIVITPSELKKAKNQLI